MNVSLSSRLNMWLWINVWSSERLMSDLISVGVNETNNSAVSKWLSDLVCALMNTWYWKLLSDRVNKDKSLKVACE